MPVTPLHIGPGILLKAFGGQRISLAVFALAQITMDLEVTARIAVGSARWHGFTNTFVGATAILLPTVFFGKPVCEWVLRWWNRNLSPGQAAWLQVPARVGWGAAWTGGVLGVYSHVLLDAVMHSDASPWGPFSEENPLVDLLSVGQLNLLCLGALIIGTVVMGLTSALRRRSGDGSANRTAVER